MVSGQSAQNKFMTNLSLFILAQASNQGATDAITILDGALNGSQIVVQSFDSDWQQLIAGSSPVYAAIISVCLSASAILVGFWSIGWMKTITAYGIDWKTIEEMTWPTIVVLLLAVNQGALLANTSLVFRGISNYMNDRVLDVTRDGVTLREAIREVNFDRAFSQAIKVKLQQCEQLPNITTDPETGETSSPREKCQKGEIEAARRAASEYRTKNQIPAYKGTWNPAELVGQVLNSAVQGLLYIMLSGLEAGFQYLLQMSFLLAAYTGPIFVSLSLLPLGTKPIYGWLSGWLALGLIMISYSIIVGMAASSIVNANSSNPLFFPLITGLLSPILAVGIGAGGGLALFFGFTGSAGFVAGRF